MRFPLDERKSQKLLRLKQICTEKRCPFKSHRLDPVKLTLLKPWTGFFLHFKNLTLVKINLHRTWVIFRSVNRAFTDIH